MPTQKNMGVWMDHSSARLLELKNDEIITNKIDSGFTHEDKEDSLRNKGEYLMHNKEQSKQADYYKKIGDIIKDCNEVVLFGPTTAKNELLNLLKEDHHFENVKIDVIQTDKMTENQQHAFVKNYFQTS